MIYECLNCGLNRTLGKNSKGLFCSYSCQQKFRRYNLVSNHNAGIRALRTFLFENKIRQCEVCFIYEWNKFEAPLEIDHIDGNSSNNQVWNLRLICPNCHAQTPTYKAKNKGNGRAYRMKRYHSGQSY